jgi:cytochrome c oxidase assembly protein Cox11
MTQDPNHKIGLSAEDQRTRTRGANRALALLLIGGALMMLAAAFAVALLVTHG